MTDEATATQTKRRGIAGMVDGSLAIGQTTIPGTEPKKPRRRSLLEQAVVGDLVVGVSDGVLVAIEQVLDGVEATEVKQRWEDQGVGGPATKVEVWEARPGGYYRRRRAGR